MLAGGVGAGLVAATLLARSMSGVLYGISPFDLPAFLIAAFGLAAAGLIATLLPAMRATRVDPMVALREP
jgi:putative ABC transport system permease protein